MESEQYKSDLIIGRAKEEFRKFIAYEIMLITGREDGSVPLNCNISRIEGDGGHQLSTENVTGVWRNEKGDVFVDCFSEREIMELDINEIKVICDEIEKKYTNNLSHRNVVV